MAAALLTAACLAPFALKPYHIDDPMYLWVVHRILEHPLDFFGVMVNWTGRTMAMHAVNQNPPLMCYWLAPFAWLLGMSEPAMHCAMMAPAIGAALATMQLARRFCPQRSELAAVSLTLFMPVFLISASTVMCDVTMLCLWLWAMVHWERGLAEGRAWRFAAAAALAGAAAITKYNGLTLLPLLAAWSLARPGQRSSILWLTVSVAIFTAFECLTLRLYGHAHFLSALAFAKEARAAMPGATGSPLVALCFTGGCMACVLFFAPFLWRWHELVLGVLAAAAVMMIAIAVHPASLAPLFPEGAPNVPALAQFGAWTACGASILLLAGLDLLQRRSVDSLVLALWVLGTFAFAATVNWTINGRSVLVMAPAVAMLTVRRVSYGRPDADASRPTFGMLLCGSASAALALLLCWADQSLAQAGREAAARLMGAHGMRSGKVFFEGHWGFQWYMEQYGAVALDYADFELSPGDILVIPRNNTGLRGLPPSAVAPVGQLEVETLPFVSTMNGWAGAGFYSEVWGPLPFVFGPIRAESYEMYQATRRLGTPNRAPGAMPGN